MRTLEFNKPYKITQTKIEDGKRILNPEPVYYSRFSTITTKYGIVTASEMNWQHNFGRTFCTLFSTVKDGFIHSAWVNKAGFSDRNLKWLATNFIKRVNTK